MANSREKRLSPEARHAGLSRPECRTDPGWGQLSQPLLPGMRVWLTGAHACCIRSAIHLGIFLTLGFSIWGKPLPRIEHAARDSKTDPAVRGREPHLERFAWRKTWGQPA